MKKILTLLAIATLAITFVSCEKEKNEEEVVVQEDNTIYEITQIDVAPDFPGGIPAFQKYLSDNIRYPAIAREAGIQGVVYVSFVIEKDGSISNVEIIRGIGGGCDEEVVRVVQGMPKWTPAKRQGKIVRVRVSTSVRFTLAG